MINLKTIKNPHYKNREKNMIGFEYETDQGDVKQAFLAVPGEGQTNREYNHIIKEFGLDYLEEIHEKTLEATKRRYEMEKLKAEGAKEADELALLFKLKAETFKLPWIKNADDDTQSAVRRAPTKQVLDCILANEMNKYMTEKSMDYDMLLDEVDDLLYED